MSLKELRLVPVAAEAVPDDIAALAVSLREIGFLGEELEAAGTVRHRPGPEFHACIVFASSHPVVTLEAEGRMLVPADVTDSRQLCTIAFSKVSATPEFGGGPETTAPRCPACGHTVSDWADVLSDWWADKANHSWSCPGCGALERVYDFDWQHRAALSRFEISVERIKFGEAGPSPKLLNALASATGFQWTHYFY